MELKPLFWVGQSKKDYAAFPEDVHDAVGYALHKAQGGDKHPSAKPLKGFTGAGVLEVVERSMSFTLFRKKPKRALPRRNRKLSWSSAAW
jgi:phage-related protein